MALSAASDECAAARGQLADALLPLAKQIVAAARHACVIDDELFNSYVVRPDAAGEYLLMKLDRHGVPEAIITDDATLGSLSAFAEDVLNGLSVGIENGLRDRAARTRVIHQELLNSGYVKSTPA